jgi:CDP-glycerol glycerophosphotransferase
MLVKGIYKVIFIVLGFLPVQKNLVIFESFLGKQYSCNPRAIYEYLRENHPEYEMFWSVDQKHHQRFKELNIPYVDRFSFMWLLLVPRARYWVTNSRMPLWLKKPRNTVYLQTWHGTPLKKLAMDMEEVHMPGTTTEEYKKNFFEESRSWDFLISPNPYSSNIFKRAFHFEKKLLETGYPRNDYLINHNNTATITKVKETLGIPKDKKVILYAPTWRDNEFFDRGKYKFTLKLDLERLQRSFGQDYIVLLRMHYLISNKLDIDPYKGFAFDFSQHHDIRDLYLISDLLITDYSSVFFDYLCLKRPIIFYTYDIDTYRDTLRGFYFDIEKDAPGPLVKTMDDLIEEISTIKTRPKEVLYKFHEKFCNLEKGVSTKRVVESVFLERATR